MKDFRIPDFSGIELSYASISTISDMTQAKLMLDIGNTTQALLLYQKVAGNKSPISSSIANLYCGFINIAIKEVEKAMEYWKQGLINAPLAQVYHILKLELMTNADNIAVFVLLQMVVNRIANDGFNKVTNKKPLMGINDFGEVNQSNIDNYLRTRIINYAYSVPECSQNTQAGIKLLKARSPIVEYEDIRVLQDNAKTYKREGNLVYALHSYHTIHTIYPDYSANYYNRAKICYLLNKPQWALLDLLRTIHLETHFSAMYQTENPALHIALQNQSDLLLDFLNNVNPIAKYILTDPNTAIHLGHAVADACNHNFTKLPDYDLFQEAYVDGLMGKSKYPASDIGEMFKMVGVVFAVENLRWNEIDNINVTEFYGLDAQFSFEMAKSIGNGST